MIKIMIVEDDRAINKQLSEKMTSWGYDVRTLNEDELNDVMKVFESYEPQLILMDINLGIYDGFYWCKKIRDISKVPIIFLSSRDTNMDIVMAVNMGADDYVTKPFALEVLTAKIQAVLRRTYDYAETKPLELSHRGARLDASTQTIIYEDRSVNLTKNEFLIAEILFKNVGSVLDRNKIIRRLWNDEAYINENTLAVNISRLRGKLKDLGLEEFITTKIGRGYGIL